MKRVFIWLLLLVMLLNFAACKRVSVFSSSDNNSSEQDYENTSGIDLPPISSPQEYFNAEVYLDAATGKVIQYLFHQPAKEAGKTYPLVIFLHGLGDAVNMQTMETATQFVDSLI